MDMDGRPVVGIDIQQDAPAATGPEFAQRRQYQGVRQALPAMGRIGPNHRSQAPSSATWPRSSRNRFPRQKAASAPDGTLTARSSAGTYEGREVQDRIILL